MEDDCGSPVFLRQKHHRRPISLDGEDEPSNISYVKRKEHSAWHVLFGNMNSYQICSWLNDHLKPELLENNLFIECAFINGSEVNSTGKNNSKNKNKIDKAWKRLFGSLETKKIINYINNTWIDPSYHLYVRTKKASTD